MANPQMDQSKMLKPPSIDFHEVRPRVVLGLTRQELFKIKIVGIVLNGLASLIFFMIFNYITVRAYALKFFDNFPLNDLTIFSMLMFSFFTRVVSFFSLIFENEKALRLGLVMASMNFIFATLFLFGIGGDGNQNLLIFSHANCV